MRRRTVLSGMAAAAAIPALGVGRPVSAAPDDLSFDPDDHIELTTTTATDEGEQTVVYHFHRAITYVADPVDAKCQCLNVSVPVRINGNPVDGTYYGVAPAAIVDLKAAVRYVRYNRDRIPGDVERIATSGTSAGGALSALLGATGDSRLHRRHLDELGAAPAFDAFDVSSPENSLFGAGTTEARHFTRYGLHHSGGNRLDHDLPAKLRMMNDAVPGRGQNAAMYWDAGHAANEDAGEFIRWMGRVTGYRA